MGITSLQNISSSAIKQVAQTNVSGLGKTVQRDESFSGFFQKAMDNINSTNSYLSDAENEEIKWALGESQNTHDLTVALGKATTALQYTVAVRDKLLEAYKEIMQMQI